MSGDSCWVRQARPGDLDALYAIALATGASGADASHLHGDPRLIGHIYAAPYLTLAPELAFVAEDEAGVAGYIVGALDTTAFEALLEERWWPALRARYQDPSGTPPAGWSADEIRAWQIHHPWRTPRRLSEPYPSHLHVNLLPRRQGRGMGKALMDAWLSRVRSLGSRGAHLGVGPANSRGVKFYHAYGWRELESEKAGRTVWFVMDLPGG
ncbi:MAG TPA: GNAT family N-acetyltransferase [Caulobacteraceae bacterium]|jgi:ribosomal protein S18 acetylase RimI-like enzyme|nr:GNAT family N-acetyltransferase [Caulobacteraceae bacterium]